MATQPLNAVSTVQLDPHSNTTLQPAWWDTQLNGKVCACKLANSFENFVSNIDTLGTLLCDSRTISTEDSAHVGQILCNYSQEARGLVALWRQSRAGS